MPAFAQAPELGGLLPSGGQRGQSTHVRIDGQNLAGAQLSLSGDGITVKSMQVAPAGDSLTAEFAVASGASLGPHEIRIATPKGVSNGSRFWVDVSPNYVLEQPMQEGTPPLPLEGASPVVINGRIAAKAGRDRFVFTASAGDTWTFDCFADRIRSRLDPVLELKDETGVSVRLVQSTWESDPRFCHRFAKAGRYFLTLRDSEYNGGTNYVYRLLVGRMPFVERYSPLGGNPGSTVQLTLQGTSLPAAHASVAIPLDAANGIYWTEVFPGSPIILPLLIGRESVLEAGGMGAIRPLPSLPTVVDGIFANASRARFSFHAQAKAKYLFDLLGRRIGSRIDGEIRVLDAVGKEIAANDDAPNLGKEARLEFTAPTDGNYTLEVRNVEEIMGADCSYRLKASVVAPDFRLSIATDRLSVPQGGTIALPVTVERVGGFVGQVDVTLANLPPGVTTSGGVIPAGKDSIEMTLTAAQDAVFSTADIRIRGAAKLGTKSVVHEAPAWERYEHRSIDLLLSVEYSYTRPYHLWQMLLLAVTQRSNPFTLVLSTNSATLNPGGTIEIPVHIVRHADAKGDIKFEIRGLPAKVSATAAPILFSQTEGKIVLTAAPDAVPDLANVIVQAKDEKGEALAPAIVLSLQKK